MKCEFCKSSTGHTDLCPNNPGRVSHIKLRIAFGKIIDYIRDGRINREHAVDILHKFTTDLCKKMLSLK